MSTKMIVDYLPTYDVRSAHQIEVDAPAAVTYSAARGLDAGRSRPVALLLGIRAIPHVLMGKMRPSRSLTFDSVLALGFVMLEEDAPNRFVMGAVGRFWRPDSGMIRIDPDAFQSFATPGYAKATVSFTVEERGDSGSLLATETRVQCTDAAARRKFSLYWRAIGPFSGFIRHSMLNQAKRTAEIVGYRSV
jgi:hypothetical protein